MNPFTEHTQQQGVTYVQHWCFAMGIAWRLFCSVVAFVLHAMLPFIDIERRLDLEATAAFIYERNEWIEGAKENKQAGSQLSNVPEHKRSGKQIAHVFVRSFLLFI